ncbi:hypothetical protein ACHAPJ_009116 [Fusarium lateritium]
MDPLSVIASIISILGAIKGTYKTIESIKDLPEAFRVVEKNLPFAQNILKIARNRLEAREDGGNEIPEHERNAVQSILESCERSADALKTILKQLEDKCLKERSEKNWAKARGWYRIALQYSKRKRVETLMEEVLSGVEKLIQQEIFQLATTEDVDKLKQDLMEAIKGLSEVEPSIDDPELDNMGGVHAEQYIGQNGHGQQNINQGGTSTNLSGKYNQTGESAQMNFGKDF